MIQPGDHITDLILSAAIDEQLTLDETRLMHAHLETCSVCRARLDELRSVAVLLRALPELEVPRDFVLGPRLVADPPNVVRLRRWYGFARAGAASLAAVFVFLSVGAFYLDAQPGSSTVGLSAQSQFASAPAPAENVAPQQSGAAAKSAPAGPTSPAVRAVAPAAPAPAAPNSASAARAASPAAALAGRAQSAPAATSAEVADQVSATTSVRPLPTPVPTVAPIPPRAPSQDAPQPSAATRAEPGAPLRTAAAGVGLLAVAGLLGSLVIRHRLRAAAISPTE